MGRTGGSGGSHRSSGGGHRSSSRSSGGHRVSSSRSSSSSGRSSSSFGRTSSGFGGYPGHRPPPPPPSYHRPHSHYHHTTVYYGDSYSGGYRRRSSGGFLSALFMCIALIFALYTIGMIFAAIGSFVSQPETSIIREKLDTAPTFNNNCIIDETGEFNSPSHTAGQLRKFYDITGVQPYIIWKDYDPALSSDKDKEEWALSYYDDNNLSENTFMYVYFEEANDYGDGYMYYVNGKQSASVMDAEAVDIFWNYVDRYWEDDISTDQLFVNVFTKTGNVIMRKPSNKWDAIRPIIIGFVICAICLCVAQVIKARAKKKHQEAEDAERILNTPLTPVGSGSSNAAVEDALSKYGDNNQ